MKGAKISTTLTVHQVVPQVTAAEAAGQVLSNSVGRVMVEGEDGEVEEGVEKDHKVWGRMMEFSDVVENMLIN